MNVQKIEKVTGRGVPLIMDDVDTDRIIPARYLRCVTFEGLGDHAFEDDRRQDPSHPFNDPQFQQAGVLITGRNFGCGSSREHAPQSLARWGIHAIVAESFAEIFFGNCTSLGIPAVCVTRPDLQRLADAVRKQPTLTITVDLSTSGVRFGPETCRCTIPESARRALVTGEWDFLSQLLVAKDEISNTASRLPYLTNFA